MKNTTLLALTLLFICTSYAQQRQTVNIGKPISNGKDGAYFKNLKAKFLYQADGKDGVHNISVYLILDKLTGDFDYYLYNGNKYYFSGNNLIDSQGNIIYDGVIELSLNANHNVITATNSISTVEFDDGKRGTNIVRHTIYEGKEDTNVEYYSNVVAKVKVSQRFRKPFYEKKIDAFLNKPQSNKGIENREDERNTNTNSNTNKTNSNKQKTKELTQQEKYQILADESNKQIQQIENNYKQYQSNIDNAMSSGIDANGNIDAFKIAQNLPVATNKTELYGNAIVSSAAALGQILQQNRARKEAAKLNEERRQKRLKQIRNQQYLQLKDGGIGDFDKNGNKTGEWQFYDKKMMLIKLGKYKDNYKVGKWLFFYGYNTIRELGHNYSRWVAHYVEYSSDGKKMIKKIDLDEEKSGYKYDNNPKKLLEVKHLPVIVQFSHQKGNSKRSKIRREIIGGKPPAFKYNNSNSLDFKNSKEFNYRFIFSSIILNEGKFIGKIDFSGHEGDDIGYVTGLLDGNSKKSGIWYVYDKKETFLGEYRTFEPIMTINFKDGLKDGYYKNEYWEGYFIKDKKAGTWKNLRNKNITIKFTDDGITGLKEIRDENGNLIAKGLIQNDINFGEWTYYYPNKNYDKLVTFQNGSEVKVKRYFYYKNGNKKELYEYKNKKIWRALERYELNGKQTLFNGTGVYKGYDENGVLIYECEMTNGMRNGVAKWFYKNGQIKKSAIYKKDQTLNFEGLRWEVLSSFDINGKQQDKGNLKNGNGTWIEYDTDGNVSRITTYKNGIKVN